jgi:hypothetical protein
VSRSLFYSIDLRGETRAEEGSEQNETVMCYMRRELTDRSSGKTKERK